jgi:hypothetical protein
MSVSCEYRALSDRGLCDGLITRPEESYRLNCDREASTKRKPIPLAALELKVTEHTVLMKYVIL